MSDLKKWTRGLRGKLLLLGATPLVLMIALAIYAESSINGLEDKLNYAYQVRAKLNLYVGHMEASVHAVGRWSWIANGFVDNVEKQNLFIQNAKAEVTQLTTTVDGAAAAS
jgi:uncharacterized protein with GYD domain